MPRGASPKREHEYEELKDRFKEEGRYRGREEEVASRIVNEQRAQLGETKGAEQQEREGKSPDRNLPIPGYRHLTIGKIAERLPSLSKDQIETTERYEKDHKNRKKLIEQMDECLHEK